MGGLRRQTTLGGLLLCKQGVYSGLCGGAALFGRLQSLFGLFFCRAQAEAFCSQLCRSSLCLCPLGIRQSGLLFCDLARQSFGGGALGGRGLFGLCGRGFQGGALTAFALAVCIQCIPAAAVGFGSSQLLCTDLLLGLQTFRFLGEHCSDLPSPVHGVDRFGKPLRQKISAVPEQDLLGFIGGGAGTLGGGAGLFGGAVCGVCLLFGFVHLTLSGSGGRQNRQRRVMRAAADRAGNALRQSLGQ